MQNVTSLKEVAGLPDTARVIAGLIGLDTTLLLVESLGGTTFPIAQGKTRLGEIRFAALSEIIGVENARVLGDYYRNEKLYIPRCEAWFKRERNARITSDFDRLTMREGYSYPEAIVSLCIKYRLSDRQIEKILKGVWADE